MLLCSLMIWQPVVRGEDSPSLKTVEAIGTVKIQGEKIVDAREEISMKEHFLSYWRKREETSIKKAIDLIKSGEARAMVSAGNTGAVMALAKTSLGAIRSIDRPALAIMVPTLKGNSLLVDVGANTDSKPHNLVQFAMMGKVFLQNVYGNANPRIALMNIGEEEVKGNELTKATHALLKKLDINFIGNVEGRDVYAGTVDVVVCDGFVGNVVLKVSEGLGEMIYGLLRSEASRSARSAVGLLLAKGALAALKKKADYAEYGGAPLLGVRGACLVGHGRSSPKAIRNAIRVAHSYATRGVVGHIERKIGELRARRQEEGV